MSAGTDRKIKCYQYFSNEIRKFKKRFHLKLKQLLNKYLNIYLNVQSRQNFHELIAH